MSLKKPYYPSLNNNNSVLMAIGFKKNPGLIILVFRIMFAVTIFLTTGCQTDKTGVKKVLSLYLQNTYDGFYCGLNGYFIDTLRLEPTENIEMVKNFGKKSGLNFHMVYTDNAYIVNSYNINRIKLAKDYALGYVSVDAVAYGYVCAPMIIKKEKIDKIYLLVKQNNKWLVLTETGEWFISLNRFINWTNYKLKDTTFQSGCREILIENLKNISAIKP